MRPCTRALAKEALATCAVILAACHSGPDPIPVDPVEHARAVSAFAAAREAELRGPDSWLSLIGLYWLEPGETTVGSAPDNGIVLPEKAAPRVGIVTVAGDTVRWRTGRGAVVTRGVDSTIALPEGSGARPPKVTGDPAIEEADLTGVLGPGKSVVLRHGDLNWIVIRRDGRWALRVRDNASAVYAAFHGIERYPTSLDWRFTARWIPHDKTVSVPNVLGTVSEQHSPAALAFVVGGERKTLDVVGEPDQGRYMLVFADATSGVETYGGGRFLWVDGPDEQGRVVLDFNYAYNPPCVWTPWATCPLPTRDNRLDVRVEAGEKNWAHHAAAGGAATTEAPADTAGGAPGTPLPALEGTEWAVTELEGAPPADGLEATLTLDRDTRQAAGSGGCAGFTGTYELAGARLTFGTVAAGRAACPADAMAFENAYLRALGRVGSYRLTGSTLDLLGEAGAVVRLRAR